ncbi:sensor histidine kinase [Flavobacterium sp.]|uniref:tetratricopeptide repeat-containing sensor histidine kinase n=1 Tax=Flavobacterium sp. TaxID=239 RepID=UPI0026024B58|nr:sensor histidine kinase [Flavobacterium sp.]
MRIRILLTLIIVPLLCFSQNKKSIDSINAIPFEQKQQKASLLVEVFLKNSEDAKKCNYSLGEAQSYSNLSLVYYYQGKYEKDLFYSLKAIAAFEKMNDKEKLAIEFGELGYRMKKRDLLKAQKYLQKGMSIAQKNNLQKPLLSIYNNYGVLKEMQNQLDSALFFYNEGLELKEKIRDSLGIPYSLNNIAGVYLIRKQYEKAKINYQKALDIRQKLKDQIGVSENLSYFGDLYLAQKQYNQAINFYQKTADNTLKSNYVDLLQYSYKKLSECYELQGNTNLALKNFKNYAQFKDSIINKETNAAIAELEVKFETNEKEKLLLQKEIEVKNTRDKLIAVSSLALFIGLIGFLIYRQQKLKNKQQEQEFQLKSAIKEIESQNQLQEQRLSISRDLHDNIGAQLTFVISSVDNLKHGNQITDNKITNQLTKISDFTKSTIIELRDTIWAMNNNEFSFEDLRSRIFNFIEKAKSAKEDVDFKFNVYESLQDLKFSSIVGINLYRTIQESVNNAVKYADANEILVEVKNVSNKIQIEIQDNGKGFDIENTDFGNGLHNMKKRIEEIDGTFEINSLIDRGTKIRFEIPKI